MTPSSGTVSAGYVSYIPQNVCAVYTRYIPPAAPLTVAATPLGVSPAIFTAEACPFLAVLGRETVFCPEVRGAAEVTGL